MSSRSISYDSRSPSLITHEEVSLINALQFDSATMVHSHPISDFSPEQSRLIGASSGLTPMFNHFDPFIPNSNAGACTMDHDFVALDTTEGPRAPPATPITFNRHSIVSSPLQNHVLAPEGAERISRTPDSRSQQPNLITSPLSNHGQSPSQSISSISSGISNPTTGPARKKLHRKTSPLGHPGDATVTSSSPHSSRSGSSTHSNSSVRLTPAQIMEIAPQHFNAEPLSSNSSAINTTSSAPLTFRMMSLPLAEVPVVSNDPMEYYESRTAPIYVASSENSTTGSMSSGSSKGSETLQPTMASAVMVDRGDVTLDILESLNEGTTRRNQFMEAAEYIAELQRTETEKVRQVNSLEAEIKEMKQRLMKE
ncbi:hypothetical protein BDR26DRAFT_26380 [Obelidium mucronatum]|nr:hypothetical protein BDR26DRAFT_26380 [Obelidium mucronatum]